MKELITEWRKFLAEEEGLPRHIIFPEETYNNLVLMFLRDPKDYFNKNGMGRIITAMNSVKRKKTEGNEKVSVAQIKKAIAEAEKILNDFMEIYKVSGMRRPSDLFIQDEIKQLFKKLVEIKTGKDRLSFIKTDSLFNFLWDKYIRNDYNLRYGLETKYDKDKIEEESAGSKEIVDSLKKYNLETINQMEESLREPIIKMLSSLDLDSVLQAGYLIF